MNPIPVEILKKAVRGDLESFEAIYKSTAGFVYNVAYRIAGNRQDAEEVTQEVFVSIYRNLKYFRMESSFTTWAYRIAVNCAINYSKKASRELGRKQEYREYMDSWQAPKESGPAGASHGETVNILLKALNPDQRACMVLRNIEGLSYQEIADSLKISINTVRSRLKRAREKLLAMRNEVVTHEL